MNARYNSSDNTLTEISQIEKPVRPNQRDYDQVSLGGLIYYADLKKYFLDSDKYNDHIASLRKLPCSPDCVGRFIHDCDYEAGKDYEIKTAGDWKWCTQLKGNVFAAPIVPVKSEDDQDSLW